MIHVEQIERRLGRVEDQRRPLLEALFNRFQFVKEDAKFGILREFLIILTGYPLSLRDDVLGHLVRHGHDPVVGALG